MNQRISDLMYQAGLTAQGCWDSFDAYDKAAIEAFAELIVRECIQVGGPEDSHMDDWFKAKADSVAKIKKHFGVEE